MVKIICAPDSYKESLSAVAAARAMADGIRGTHPGVPVDCCPVGDGGEGTLEALQASCNIRRTKAAVMGAYGATTMVNLGYFADGQRAYIESAQCIGLQLTAAADRNVMVASSFGVGEMLLQAAQSGAREIFIGVGGSGTNDGGCGMAQALGIRVYDADDQLIAVPLGGAALQRIARFDTSALSPLLQDVSVSVVCDVTNPLTGSEGATQVYGPQKGADETQVEFLEAGMKNLASVIRRQMNIDIENIPGSGAAGGLAGALAAFTHANIRSGIEFVLDMTRFSERVNDCDLCLTGEGQIDAQSTSGKTCLGVAKFAAAKGVPAVALVGAKTSDAENCLNQGLANIVVIGEGLSTQESMSRCTELLGIAAAHQVGKLA